MLKQEGEKDNVYDEGSGAAKRVVICSCEIFKATCIKDRLAFSQELLVSNSRKS